MRELDREALRTLRDLQIDLSGANAEILLQASVYLRAQKIRLSPVFLQDIGQSQTHLRRKLFPPYWKIVEAWFFHFLSAFEIEFQVPVLGALDLHPILKKVFVYFHFYILFRNLQIIRKAILNGGL